MSVDGSGTQGNAASLEPAISADGRSVRLHLVGLEPGRGRHERRRRHLHARRRASRGRHDAAGADHPVRGHGRCDESGRRRGRLQRGRRRRRRSGAERLLLACLRVGVSTQFRLQVGDDPALSNRVLAPHTMSGVHSRSGLCSRGRALGEPQPGRPILLLLRRWHGRERLLDLAAARRVGTVAVLARGF